MRYRIMFLALACAHGAFATLSREELSAIEDAFSPTNWPALVDDKLYPINTNVWFNLYKTNPSHGRELQYCILSNLCAFKKGDREYWLRWGMVDRKSMFYAACEFEPTTNDVQYLNLCADFLGQELVPIEYEHDVRGGRYAWYNEDVQWTKTQILKWYKELCQSYEKLLEASEVPSFRTNIITRARLTPEEQRILWPTE